MAGGLDIKFRLAALQEFELAAQWYEEQRKGLGSAFMLSMESILSTIQRNPELFPRVEGETRRAPMKRFPFSVFYAIEPDGVIVTAVFHSRRNPADREGH